MSEVLEQYFPSGVSSDDHAMIQDIAASLSMCSGSSKKKEQNNGFMDIRTIGSFVFYVFDFSKQLETLPFKPQKEINGISDSGIFHINKDGELTGEMTGMGYAFSFEDRGGAK